MLKMTTNNTKGEENGRYRRDKRIQDAANR